MNYQSPETHHKEWKEGRFKPVYLFVGNPTLVADAVARLKSEFKASDFDFSSWNANIDESVSAIISDALTSPVMGPRRLVLIETPKIPVHARTVIKEYLENPLGTTTLVLISDDYKPDSKDSLVKAAQAKGAVCHCQPMKEGEAQNKLIDEAHRSGKILARDAASRLVGEAGTDWPILQQELNKAMLYAGESKSVELRHILDCLGYQKDADPFLLPRLVRRRDLVKTLRHLLVLLNQGKKDEQAFKALNQITSSILKQLRGKKMVRAGRSEEEIMRALRLNQYYDQGFKKELESLSDETLRRDLELCLRVDSALKSQAWLAPPIEVSQLVGALCRAGGAN